MTGIYHDVLAEASEEDVFRAIAEPDGLCAWWTLKCAGIPEVGHTYQFGFGPGFDWKGRVRECAAPSLIAWQFIDADADWTDTVLKLSGTPVQDGIRIRLEHSHWKSRSAHFRRTSYCWAQYLRLLKDYVETGTRIAYADRQSA